MADEEHLKIIRQGVAAWNDWREENPEAPDLHGANLCEANLGWANLSGADLTWANLRRADLSGADLFRADLRGANLSRANLTGLDLTEGPGGPFSRGTDLRGANLRGANLREADLSEADLTGANLSEADLGWANLTGADLSAANLSEANLTGAQLIATDLGNAILTESRVYGASVWKIKVDEHTKQQNLIITEYGKPDITVDNIKVAQFIYLLLDNKEIRDVIDTITSKAVLILGRFSDERKPVLDAIRDELRNHNYLPILFDFTPSARQSTVETVKTLAGMARFIIADLTDAKSVLQELQAIVPDFPSVAVRFLIKKPQREPGMLDHITRFPWVIKGAYEYEREAEVIASIQENVIGPAEAKVKELRPRN
jgi:uncharacterized protein YjbI with pentapeptide repeats